MQWIEITVNTKPEELDELCSRLNDCGISGLVIEDEQSIRTFLEENKQYWDYIDEELEKSIQGICRVKFYLENTEKGFMHLGYVRSKLKVGEKLNMRPVKDSDWENNWKQYYKPIKVGNKLLIVPEWEENVDSEGRTVVKLDPGLMFGTGSHPTTQMCLEALEYVCEKGKNILDLGCGSGILAIAALKLGCDYAIGCDIDEKSPEAAMDNARLNLIADDHVSFIAGDVTSDEELRKELLQNRYEIITANIVADVIIALAPGIKDYMTDDGIFICSGIIEGREEEVIKALINSGLEIMAEFNKNGWFAYACCKQCA